MPVLEQVAYQSDRGSSWLHQVEQEKKKKESGELEVS